MTNPNATPNTPGLIRLARAELERVRREREAAGYPVTSPLLCGHGLPIPAHEDRHDTAHTTAREQGTEQEESSA